MWISLLNSGGRVKGHGRRKDSRYSDEVITKSPSRRYVSLMGGQGNEDEKVTNGSISGKISDSVW